MIRIIRGPEPPDVRRARIWRLARAGLRWLDDRTVPGAFDGYDKGRAILWDQQHHKCAYCEAPYLRRSAHIEHYRPKATYWWLAWSWDNLLQICGTCNTVKKDGFDLHEPHDRLSPLGVPPGDERPKLIDPARTDPRRHIRFARKPDPENPDRLRWEPEALTDEGRHTIEALSMHDDLLDNYMLFAEHFTGPTGPLAPIRRAIERGQDARQRFWEVVTDHLAAHQPYRSLAHDILTDFRDEMCNHRKIDLPPVLDISDDRQPTPYLPLLPPDPTLDGWPLQTQLHIRLVRSGQSTVSEREAALIAVLREGPQTRNQLADLFGKKPATVRGWLKPLIPAQIESEGRGANTIYRLPQDP